MKSKEREKLAIVRGLLDQADEALANNPVNRGLALGAVLDAKEIIEQLAVEVKPKAASAQS